MQEHEDDYEAPASSLSELVEQAHWPLGMGMCRNIESLYPLGLTDPPAQRLGRGSFGAAYRTPLRSRSVLKFTRDPSEVQASMLLVGKKPERIVHVYGVWALPGTFRRGMRGWYLVHRDYLSPLSKQDRMLIDVIFEIYDDETLDLTIPRRRNFAMIDKWRGYIREEIVGEGLPMDDEGQRMAAPGGTGKLISRAIELLMQIGEGVAEMHKHGIDWEDIHSGNMMRNQKGTLVVADVGWGLMHHDFDHTVPFITPEAAAKHAAAFTEAISATT